MPKSGNSLATARADNVALRNMWNEAASMQRTAYSYEEVKQAADDNELAVDGYFAVVENIQREISPFLIDGDPPYNAPASLKLLHRKYDDMIGYVERNAVNPFDNWGKNKQEIFPVDEWRDHTRYINRLTEENVSLLDRFLKDIS